MAATRAPLTIGQVADAANVNLQTIRYYERRRLLPATRRSASGYRLYDQDAIRRVRFIRRAQALGFSLQEVSALLALRVRNKGTCEEVERRTRTKISLIEQKISDLQRIRRSLQRLAAACAERRATPECPVLDALEDRRVGR